jgi:hypothetical protein
VAFKECIGFDMRVEVGAILRSSDGRLFLVLEVKWAKKAWHRRVKVKSLDSGLSLHLPYTAIKHMEVICE